VRHDRNTGLIVYVTNMAMRARHSLRPLLRLRGGHGHASAESKAVLFGEEVRLTFVP
jgi:hypothetical protein